MNIEQPVTFDHINNFDAAANGYKTGSFDGAANGYAAGRQAEQDDIVAWLCTVEARSFPSPAAAADAIRRGAHRVAVSQDARSYAAGLRDSPAWAALGAAGAMIHVVADSLDRCHDCGNLATWTREAIGNANWDSCDDCIESFREMDRRAESKGCGKRAPWEECDDAAIARLVMAADAAVQKARSGR